MRIASQFTVSKKLLLISTIILSVFFSGVSTEASVIRVQADNSSYTTGTNGYSEGWNISTTLTATTSVRFWVKGTQGGFTPRATFNRNAGGCTYQRDFTSSQLASLNTSSYTMIELELPRTVNTNCGVPADYSLTLAGFTGTTTVQANGLSQMTVYIETGSLTPVASGVTISSPNAQVYAGNPIIFGGSYSNNDTYNKIQFDLVLATTTPIQEFPDYDLPAVNGSFLTWGTFDYYFGYAGPYTVRARLYDTVTGSTTAWSATTSFAVATTSFNPAYSIESVVGTIECGDWDLFCMGKQLVAWSITPSTASVNRILALNDNLSDRTPFVYVYQVSDILVDGYNATTTASSSLVIDVGELIPSLSSSSLTLISAQQVQDFQYTPYIRNLLSAMLWLIFMLGLYYRVINIHSNDKQ